MQQTLLALLALMTASFLSFSQMQAIVKSEREMVRSELEEMATGIAMQSMEVIRARAFDDALVGVPSDSTVSTSDFTSSPFTSGNDCEAFGGSDVCDDVDDYHEMVPATVPFKIPDDQIDFKVEVEVQYVDNLMQPTSSKTIRKEVIIRVQDIQADGTPVLARPVVFSETLAYN
jgi:hypothetical protein